LGKHCGVFAGHQRRLPPTISGQPDTYSEGPLPGSGTGVYFTDKLEIGEKLMPLDDPGQLIYLSAASLVVKHQQVHV
jgi:hypothetical protein